MHRISSANNTNTSDNLLFTRLQAVELYAEPKMLFSLCALSVVSKLSLSLVKRSL